MGKSAIFMSIQRPVPFVAAGPRKTHHLDTRDIHPVVRIAHRVMAPLVVRPRIIFDHELVLILRGSGQFVLGKQRFAMQPHELYCIPPFVPHYFDSDRVVCEHIAVHMDLSPAVPGPGTGVGSGQPKPYDVRFPEDRRLPPRVTLTSGHRVEELLQDVLQLWTAQEPLYELEVTLRLMQVLAWLLRHEDEAPADPRGRMVNRARIEKAIAYMQTHYADSISADELAHAAGLSPNHFRRQFQEWTGYSPISYLRRLRVDKARQLLADVSLSIKEIAGRTGFGDAFHFSKVFRQIDGLPPTLYRESLLGEESQKLEVKNQGKSRK